MALPISKDGDEKSGERIRKSFIGHSCHSRMPVANSCNVADLLEELRVFGSFRHLRFHTD
jgi:hypothetical protein